MSLAALGKKLNEKKIVSTVENAVVGFLLNGLPGTRQGYIWELLQRWSPEGSEWLRSLDRRVQEKQLFQHL